ncbi:MAG TPA: 1,4-alpha-glucan branching protein domain-containing protein, partial [Bacillota bacterium]|nr:1,4-alpha-glucan branching protein domain-containing protein [Bacillota bacterium]
LNQVSFAHSSWGEGGYSRYWLNPKNDWVYPYYHRAEKLMERLAETYKQPTPLQKRALNQAARELMLAQSSDWPFILTSGTMVEYAQKRLHNHLTNFYKINRALKHEVIDEAELHLLEVGDQIFPHVDYRVYQPKQGRFEAALKALQPGKPLILMLSWEFPPQHVGGLGIHVRDLSIELVRLGWNVQVLTVAHDGNACFKVVQGVGVHFIPTLQTLDDQEDFLAWMLQLNLALADYGREFVGYLNNPVILHAHDWLVAYAARELQTAIRVPLVTTIHATEHGRNNGINTAMQQAIHQIETELVQASHQVICCSRYMQREIQQLFGVPATHLHVIVNGVKLIQLPQRTGFNHTILYVGRLVVEKGVQHLLQALPGLTGLFPDLKLVVAGNGPYQQELQDLAWHLGVGERVEFTGFVSESRRNQLLADCRVAVFPSLYEPFGIVALEAMAAGVPVIVARTGGLMETVQHDETGLCFHPGDVADLQHCLIRVLQNAQWSEDMSRRAKTVAGNKYTWEAVARQTSRVYQKELYDQEQQAN